MWWIWQGAKWLPTLRPGQMTRAVSPPVGCQKPHPPSPFIIIDRLMSPSWLSLSLYVADWSIQVIQQMAHWQSTVLWAAAANRANESDRWPTGLPRLRIADYAASACITGVNWLNMSIRSFLYRIDLYFGPVQTPMRPMQYFVTVRHRTLDNSLLQC